MRMSVAEKVRCYPLDDKGTDAAFEMVRTYFEKIGMDTSFDSVYEETKLLTDYYEKLKAEEFIQKKTEQIIEKMDMMGIDKLGVNMTYQERYEVFDRIYEEGVREKKRVNSRTLR